MTPIIEQLNQEIDERTVESAFKAKSRACECVKSMMGKSLHGYFNHWKQIN